MELIIVGLYNELDRNIIKQILSNVTDMEIEWNYEKYNIESFNGIKLLEEKYNLYCTGVLIEKDRKESFTSYPLIDEITEFYIGGGSSPKLFNFMNELKNTGLHQLVIAFANTWNKKTLVRIKKVNINKLTEIIRNIHSWYEVYTNLENNEEIRSEEHPLILEIDQGNYE